MSFFTNSNSIIRTPEKIGCVQLLGQQLNVIGNKEVNSLKHLVIIIFRTTIECDW